MKHIRIAAALLLVAGGLALWTGSAGAGLNGDSLGVFPAEPLNRGQAEFEFEGETRRAADDEIQDCGPGTTYQVFDGPTEIADVTITPTAPGALDGTLLVGDSVPGDFYTLVITCEEVDVSSAGADDPPARNQLSGEFAFARGIITKAVEGDVPDDASFVVAVECSAEQNDQLEFSRAGFDENFSVNRTFGSTGGTQFVIVYNSSSCLVSETDDGGAQSSSIDDNVLDFIDDPVTDTATVTNVFPVADVGGTGEEQEPAPAPETDAPVAAQPTFTG